MRRAPPVIGPDADRIALCAHTSTTPTPIRVTRESEPPNGTAGHSDPHLTHRAASGIQRPPPEPPTILQTYILINIVFDQT